MSLHGFTSSTEDSVEVQKPFEVETCPVNIKMVATRSAKKSSQKEKHSPLSSMVQEKEERNACIIQDAGVEEDGKEDNTLSEESMMVTEMEQDSEGNADEVDDIDDDEGSEEDSYSSAQDEKETTSGRRTSDVFQVKKSKIMPGNTTTTSSKHSSSSRLFQPYRTVGIITSGQGFQVQSAGTENFLVVPIGDRFQVLRVRTLFRSSNVCFFSCQ